MQYKLDELDFGFNLRLSPDNEADEQTLQKIYAMGLFAGIAVSGNDASGNQRIVEGKIALPQKIFG